MEKVSLYPANYCLLEELVARLALKNTCDYSQVNVILPTQRLSVHLLKLLGKRHPNGYFPPQVFSLDQFIENILPEQDSVPQVISSLSSELILASLIKEASYDYIKVGQEHEIHQFFMDIDEHSLSSTWFEKIDSFIRGDVYRTQEYTDSLVKRMGELKDLQVKFLEYLQTKCLVTSYEWSKKQVIRVIAQGNQVKLQGPVYLCGFTTVKAYYRELLSFLLEKLDVYFILGDPPNLMSQSNPLEDLISSLKVPLQAVRNKEGNSFGKYKEKRPSFFIHECENPLDEVTRAVDLAKNYIDQGCPPSQVAILVTDEKLYSSLMGTVTSKSFALVNCAVSRPLRQTPFGVWFKSLMELFLSEEDHRALLSFLVHPITLRFLDEKLEDKQCEKEFLSYKIFTGKITRSQILFDSSVEDEEVKITVKFIIDFLKGMKSLLVSKRKQPLSSYVKSLEEYFTSFQLLSDRDEMDASDYWQSVRQSCQHFLDALSPLSKILDSKFSPREFWQFVQEKLYSLEVRSIGYPLEGVQVLRLIEARYVPFQSMIILGCNEGSFPKALPKDFIVDDWLKRKIGLPGWSYVEALEDTTFHILRGRAKRLDLLYPKVVSGQQMIPSRFIEALLLDKSGIKVIDHSKLAAGLIPSTNTNSSSQAILKSGYDKQYPYNLVSEMSASLLESFMNCPYQFLLKKFKVSSFSFLKKEDWRFQGQKLHKILEAFFVGYQGKQGFHVIPLPNRLECKEDKELVELLLKRLVHLTQEIYPESKDSSLYPHLCYFSWPHFAKFISFFYRRISGNRYYNLTLSKSFCEVPILNEFQLVPPSCEGAFPQTVKVGGVIDALHLLGDGFLLMDYKRKSIPSAKDVSDLSSPQLMVYARSLKDRKDFTRGVSTEKLSAGYWSILGGKWKTIGQGKHSCVNQNHKLLGPSSKQDLTSLVERFEEGFTSQCREHLYGSGGFQPKVTRQCEHCDFKGVCRKNDRRFIAAR